MMIVKQIVNQGDIALVYKQILVINILFLLKNQFLFKHSDRYKKKEIQTTNCFD